MASRYHHGHLRQALLDASREILAESGARGLSLREAARRAGVSTAAPYRHFQDKQSLLIALAHQGFVRLDGELSAVAQACASEGRDPLDTVASLGVAYVDFAARHGPEFRLMFGELAPDPRASEELEQAVGAVSNHLSSAIGVLADDSPAAAEELILLAWSLVHGLSTLYLDGHLQRFGELEAEALAARIIGLLNAALRGELVLSPSA